MIDRPPSRKTDDPPTVHVYEQDSGNRSRLITRALAKGAREAGGVKVRIVRANEYIGAVADAAAFYGYHGRLIEIFKAYVEAGKPVVYVDLGYWGRKESGRFAGYHKVSVSDRHPTAYFQNRQHSADRFSRFGVKIKKWRRSQPDDPIMIAGMGPKAAKVAGYEMEQWEKKTIATLRKHTDRPIIYRAKPISTLRKQPTPIEGTTYSPRGENLDGVLARCHAVVTHHSNVAVEGLLAGVPVFCWGGVSVPLASQDLDMIEHPFYPEGREQFAADIAYCQWSVAEITSGAAWAHLRIERLVP